MTPGHDHFMADTARLEVRPGKGADLDRVVDQFVVVRRLVEPESVPLGGARPAPGLGQRRRHTPVLGTAPGRCHQFDQAGAALVAMRAQKHTGAIEEGMTVIEVRGPHRQVPRVDFAFDLERRSGSPRCAAPAMLVELFHGQPSAAAAGFERHDVARKVADHVTARNPCRQRQPLPLRIRVGDGQTDPQQVTRGVGKLDAVLQGLAHRNSSADDQIESSGRVRARPRRSLPRVDPVARLCIKAGKTPPQQANSRTTQSFSTSISTPAVDKVRRRKCSAQWPAEAHR